MAAGGGAGAPSRSIAAIADKDEAELRKDQSVWRTEVTPDGEVLVFKKGELRFPNGDVYTGEFLNNERHGKGHFRRSNGDEYRGDFKHNLFDGQGVLKKAEHKLAGRLIVGWKYQGGWRAGNQHGHGFLLDGEGGNYDGGFINGMFEGHGERRTKGGDHYVGQWKRGLYHGQGQLRLANDQLYKGNFYKGKYHGHGSLIFPNGMGSYVGEWKFGKRHGTGKRVWSGGAEYEGEFNNDDLTGKGILKKAHGDVYVGQVADGRYHGEGILQYANGDRYTGQFVRGNPCGVGRYEYASGGYYEGEYWALLRTGVKWRADEADLRDEDEDLHGVEAGGGLRWQTGAKKVTDPAARREEAKRKAERRKAAYSVDYSSYSKEARVRRFLLNRKYGRMLVGSEYDDPGVGGVLRPAADGKRHGRGVRVWTSGARYEGDWFQDEIHGFGLFIGAGAKGERFEGQWVHGKRKGRGICSFGDSDGQRYICPLGRWQSAGTRCIYDGEWDNNTFEGRGKYIWGDGRSYDGEFHLGKRHGYGVEVLLSEELYSLEIKRFSKEAMRIRPVRFEGFFEENRREGPGKLYIANGDVYEGKFHNMRLDGLVRVTFGASGRVTYAMFSRGVRQRWLFKHEVTQLQQAQAFADVFRGGTFGRRDLAEQKALQERGERERAELHRKEPLMLQDVQLAAGGAAGGAGPGN